MLDTELCSSRVLSPFRDEIGDEDLAVLPRHTKVIVTGNNRTKSVLVGLQGVVKKAVGLGGWHWLVLKNGVEVKLQRNALSVLEPPTGNEDESDDDLDNSSCSSDAVVRDNLFSSSGIEFRAKSKPRIRHSNKPWIQSTSTKLTNQSCVEVQGSTNAPKMTVNFRNLGMNSLWRYCKRFKLKTPSHNPSKQQMIDAVQQHFATQKQLDEVKVITEFISAAKRLKSTRDRDGD